MRETESLLDIVKLLWRWKRIIVLITIVSTVIFAGFSLLMPNWYRAETLFYAASPDLAKPSPVGPYDQEVDYYGESEDIDRIISIAESSQIIRTVIEEFNLIDYYELKKDDPFLSHKVRKKFLKHYVVKKTKYNAISISFEDKSPELSEKVANYCRDQVNNIAQDMIKESQSKMLDTYKKDIEEKNKHLGQLKYNIDSVKTKYGIYDPLNQGLILSEYLAKAQYQYEKAVSKYNSYQNMGNSFRDSIQYYKAEKLSSQRQIENSKATLDKYNKGITTVSALQEELEDGVAQLNVDRARMKQLHAKFSTYFSAIHLLEKAEVPVYKSRPKRSILVIAAGFAIFLFTILSIIVGNAYKNIDWED